MTNDIFAEPPHATAYYALVAPKIDLECQRNALLNFIFSRGLGNEFVDFLDEHMEESDE